MSELLQPGQIFAGRYRIEKFLAKGGFGAVYVAEQTETELRVALKVLWPHVLASEDAVGKFKLEARVAGRVGSEHIVKVFDAGFDGETRMPFLVMELLHGSELETVVENSGPISPDRLVVYFRQVASALDKAHGYVDKDGAPRPIVHRDLKPENLFLSSRETGDPIVKVLDFGIAKVLSDSTKVSQEIKGTPLYMAFEQAMAGRITPQTDIWALGLIAFYLLTGRCYWKSANLAEASITQLFGEVLSLPIDPPSQRAPEIGAPVTPPAAFDAWFARCVNRDVQLRFRTAGEAGAALAAVFGTPETRPSPGTFQPDAFAATAYAASPPSANAPSALAPSITAATAPTIRSENAPARANPIGMTTGAASALGQTTGPSTPRSRAPVIAILLVVAAGIAVVATRSSPGVSASPSPSVRAVATTPVVVPTSSNPPVVDPSPSASGAETPPVVAASASAEPIHRPPVHVGRDVGAKRLSPAALPSAVPATPKAKPTGVYDDR